MSEQPDKILNRPAATGDLAAELRQNKRSVSKLTIGLIAAVLLGGAFFGGIATHAAVADSPQAEAPRQQFPRGAGGGQGAGGQPGARGTIGTIDRIEGADIYVKTADGRTVKVSTSDSTQVRVSQEGKLSDLKQGEAVAVQGSTGSDGSVTAQTITQQPARQR